MQETKKSAKVCFRFGLTALLLSFLPAVLMAIGKMLLRPDSGRPTNFFIDMGVNLVFAIGGANLLLFSPVVTILTIVTAVQVRRAMGAATGTDLAVQGLALVFFADIVSGGTLAWLLGQM